MAGQSSPLYARVLPTGSLTDNLKEWFNIDDNELTQVENDSNVTVQQIFTFDDNQDAIYNKYRKSEQETYSQADINYIVYGTTLHVPLDFANAATEMTRERLKNDFDQFDPSQSVEVLNDYVKGMLERFSNMVRSKRIRQGIANTDETIETDPVVRVFVLSRVLNGSSGSDRLINLSPYLMSSVVNVGANGGSWTLTLDGMTAVPTGDEWGLPDDIANVSIRDGGYGDEYTSDSQTHRDTTKLKALKVSTIAGRTQDDEGVQKANVGQLSESDEPYSVRNEHVFSMLISSQDLVFIKFDPMDEEIEGGYRERDLINPFDDVRLSDFRDDYWDLIGLVDKTDENGTIADANVQVEVSGRDMMKLMIEDGVYFFPVTSADGYQTNYFANAQDTRTYRRILGEINELAAFVQKPVKDLVQFIYGKLSTVEVWPDSTFDGYDVNDSGIGVWKLTELIIDDVVGKRVMYESGLRTQSGTILSFIQTVCQSPFLEFYGDTYGNRYTYIVRRPPYTKEDILNVFEAAGEVTLTESEVEGGSLDMADEEAFSWFRILPLGFMFGDSDMAMFQFPAIYFDEYAKIYGARKMEFESRFLDYNASLSSDAVYSQSLKDLRYIIESYAYLPFSRKGTIKIRNNRRIKRGTWIYMQGTDELCYVEAVNHASSINMNSIVADTVITVSRCIKRRHLDKYFNIINFPEQTSDQINQRRVSWSVNRSVFEWFVAKKQFIS